MTPRILLFCAGLLVVPAAGCAPAPPTDEPDVSSVTGAAASAPVDGVAVAHPAPPDGRKPQQASDGLHDPEPASGASRAASSLAGALRPYDSPLPSREQLEGFSSDPVAILLELTLPSWPDGLVRGNALSELGLFPDSNEAMTRLVDVALDDARSASDRVGALEGLIIAGGAVEPYLEPLLPMLTNERVMVQAAAVRLLGPWPAARSETQRLADSDATHIDVRRFARRALESQPPNSPRTAPAGR